MNKSVVKESDGTDLTINYDWEAKGLHQGDTMVTPMFEGFDSIYKQVNFPIISDGLKIGTLRLDYDGCIIFRTDNVKFFCITVLLLFSPFLRQNKRDGPQRQSN